MSAPHTDVEKQTRRHIVPLIGIAVVTIFGVLLIVYWLFEEAADPETPANMDQVEVPETTTTSPEATPAVPQAADPVTPPSAPAPTPAPTPAPAPDPAPVPPTPAAPAEAPSAP